MIEAEDAELVTVDDPMAEVLLQVRNETLSSVEEHKNVQSECES